ncbi:hypothetical protein C8R44DRAFT_726797 [Mycena epipterygia]|nr:hypothetical protein C8R44DRAFT_726797 [Mycena epipterygia]
MDFLFSPRKWRRDISMEEGYLRSGARSLGWRTEGTRPYTGSQKPFAPLVAVDSDCVNVRLNGTHVRVLSISVRALFVHCAPNADPYLVTPPPERNSAIAAANSLPVYSNERSLSLFERSLCRFLERSPSANAPSLWSASYSALRTNERIQMGQGDSTDWKGDPGEILGRSYCSFEGILDRARRPRIATRCVLLVLFSAKPSFYSAQQIYSVLFSRADSHLSISPCAFGGYWRARAAAYWRARARVVENEHENENDNDNEDLLERVIESYSWSVRNRGNAVVGRRAQRGLIAQIGETPQTSVCTTASWVNHRYARRDFDRATAGFFVVVCARRSDRRDSSVFDGSPFDRPMGVPFASPVGQSLYSRAVKVLYTYFRMQSYSASLVSLRLARSF